LSPFPSDGNPASSRKLKPSLTATSDFTVPPQLSIA
jgi:hypothetical protein